LKGERFGRSPDLDARHSFRFDDIGLGCRILSGFHRRAGLSQDGGSGSLPAIVRSRLAWVAGIGLVFVVVSGAAWLVLQAARMIDLPLAEMFSGAAIWTVITQTDFGHVWIARLGLVGLLTAALFPLHSTQPFKPHWRALFPVVLAAGLVGTLAWGGHAAAAGSGSERVAHLTADILHLIAAAAWVGALGPLVMLLAAVEQGGDEASLFIAREAVLRFSTLGIVSVSALLASGVVNSWMLVGSARAMVGTDYGHLLSLKIALFLVMVATAGVNRLMLTPRIIRARCGAPDDPLRQLRNNSIIEAGVGVLIIVIVSVLGTLPPET
jgi:copper resistance protein D